MRFVTICEIRQNLPMENEDKYPHLEIGNRLKAIRNSTGLKVKDYVSLLDIQYTRYINWETGARRIMPDDAAFFCDKFEVTMDFIYRGKLQALPESILKALLSIPTESAQSKSTESPDVSAS